MFNNMKKAIFFLMAIISIAVVSFKNAQQENWSRWNSSANYPGIEYRTRKNSYNDYAKKWQWDIQFRNSYSRTATFSYGYSSTIANCKTDHTEYKLPAGKSSDITSFLSYESSTIWICIDNVNTGD